MLKVNYRPVIGIGLEVIAIPLQNVKLQFDLFDMSGFDMSGLEQFGQFDTSNMIDFGNDMVPEKFWPTVPMQSVQILIFQRLEDLFPGSGVMIRTTDLMWYL